MNLMLRVICTVALMLSIDAGIPRAFADTGKSPVTDRDEAILQCLMSPVVKNVEDARGWWNRRSDAQHKVILALPCEERYIPMVCIFLYEPDLIDCTNKGVADKRATAFCQAKGFDLMSQELADCKQEFKKTFKPPFPHAAS